jgi:thioredoxin 1
MAKNKLFIGTIASEGAAPTGYSLIDDAHFADQVLKAERPVVVEFWAAWCAPCKSMAPAVAALARAYDGKVDFWRMDVDCNPKTPLKFNVRGIPALIFFKGGAASRVHVVGFTKLDALKKWMEAQLG